MSSKLQNKQEMNTNLQASQNQPTFDEPNVSPVNDPSKESESPQNGKESSQAKGSITDFDKNQDVEMENQTRN